MGSSPTLDQASPSWARDGVTGQLARQQQRLAEARPTTHDLEQTFDRLNPDYGVPADRQTPTAGRPCAIARPPWPSVPASPSPHPARTTPTR
jgi:hypothetical protein